MVQNTIKNLVILSGLLLFIPHVCSQTTSESLARGTQGNYPSSEGFSRAPSKDPQKLVIGPNSNILPGPNGLSYGSFQENARQNLPPRNADPVSVAKPAWAQGALKSVNEIQLPPFASNLFAGRFSNTYADSLNSDYLIAPGDRVVLRIWGARNYDDVLIVDQQGNIFIPEVGPVHVGGSRHGELFSKVQNAIRSVYTDNVKSYVNLQTAQPVGIYVTGFVNYPGRYAGGALDSVLTFLDRAGGINAERGSYRQIQVKRNNKVIANIDLYDFAINGTLKPLRLQDGDTVVVKEKGDSVAAYGLLREEAVYEFNKSGKNLGVELVRIASPLPKVTHVSVRGVRKQVPFNKYFSLDDFKQFVLQNGDIVEFIADKQSETILTIASGSIDGASRFPINRRVKLRELLAQIAVEPDLAATDSIYLRRKSVAREQKAVIQDSLRRLEQSSLKATSSSPEEAELRVQEAKLIQDFVHRASQVEPDGVVVISRGGHVKDILLEDGDEIVIPQKSDLVQVTGEVMMPKTLTYDPRMSLDDYLASAGGLSERGNADHILVAKANGEVGLAEDQGIGKGDRIIVLPKVDSKVLLMAKDIMQIIYQIAIATKVAIDI